MTELFQELERKLAALPQEKQEEWVSHFLDELNLEIDDTNENTTDDEQWIGGRRPTQEEIDDAVEKLKQFRKGKTLGDELTLKDLINEGRRY